LIKKSNLNFSLSESPFSLSINIKKTFIRDKSGKPRASTIPENIIRSSNSNNRNQPAPHPSHTHEPTVQILHPKISPLLNPKYEDQPHHYAPANIPTKPQKQRHVFPQANFLHNHQIPHHQHHLLPLLPAHGPGLLPPHHPHNLVQETFVPNIPVENRFSCLAKVEGDDSDISNSQEIPSNLFNSEPNNNTRRPLLILASSQDVTKSFKTKEGIIVDQDEAEFLVVNNERLKQVTKRLNTELASVRNKSKENKTAAVEGLKVEIKQWRKLLGKERSQKMKLEKKVALIKSSNKVSRANSSSKPIQVSEDVSEEEIDDIETCSICVRPIPNYKPRYSSGLLWNPACSECDDDSDDVTDDENPD
jgi:hypothetical protein